MHLIVCVDERYGLSFCGKRLSRDQELTAHMLRMTSESKLWVHPYSASLFPADYVCVDVDYFDKAGPDDYCFVEKGPFPQAWDDVKSVILYRWNRAYPSTEKLACELFETMKLVSTEEFTGKSHEKITMERYIP